MDHQKEREAICEIGLSLFQRGYAHASAGNISVRLSEGFLVTPTDASLGRLAPQDLAWVDGSGRQRSGLRASKTLDLHRTIYAQSESTNAIIHTHSAHLVALTLNGVWRTDCVLPPITPYQVMKVGKVPLVSYSMPGSPQAISDIENLIRGQSPKAVLLERLGPVVWNKTLQSTTDALEELEETARLWLLTQGQIQPLDEEQIQALCQRFDVNW